MSRAVALGSLFALLFCSAPLLGQSTPREDVWDDVVLLSPLRPLFIRLHLKIDGKSFKQARADFFRSLVRFEDANGDDWLSLHERRNLHNFCRLYY